MGDRTSLQNVSVRNSGGNAVSHVQGADFQIGNCQISDNGQHGVLLYGPGEVEIVNNHFCNNGCKRYEPPMTPIPVSARQGHHIYLEGMASTRNLISIKHNAMYETFADGFALAPVFDDPTDVEIEVELQGNTIDGCGRNGLTVSASYGTDCAVARVNVVDNVIRNCGNSAISATAIFPIVPRPLRNGTLELKIDRNVLEGAEYGINVVTSFSPAEQGICNVVVSDNQILQCSINGVLMATSVGDYDWPVSNNRLTAQIFDNELGACQGIEMEFFAFQRTHAEAVNNNKMVVDLTGNSSDKHQIVVHGDESGSNVIEVQPGSQEHFRTPLSLRPGTVPASAKVAATGQRSPTSDAPAGGRQPLKTGTLDEAEPS
jgi:hypothetical protein